MSEIWSPYKKEQKKRIKEYADKVSEIGEEVIKLFEGKQLTYIDAENIMAYVGQKITNQVKALNLNYIRESKDAESIGKKIEKAS